MIFTKSGEGLNSKKCTKCGLLLPIRVFRKSELGKYGLRSTCRECDYKSNKAYQKTPKYREYENAIKRAKYALSKDKDKEKQQLRRKMKYCRKRIREADDPLMARWYQNKLINLQK